MMVWMIRHGESATNKSKSWTGWLDVPLSEEGRKDAALAREALSRVNFDKIYSSDLIRARETAEIAIPGCKYETTELIREINVGDIAGKPLEVAYDANGLFLSKDGYAGFGGESTTQFKGRINSFMKKLEGEKHERIAVFSHKGFITRFLEAVLEISIPRKHLCCKNCAIAIFEYSDSTWTLHSWINLT